MPNYYYIAKSYGGKRKKGSREANNKKDLAQLLRQEGYFLISAQRKGKAKKKQFLSFSFKHVPQTQKLMVTKNLQVMVSAGVSLPKALEVLARQTKNKYLKKALKGIKEEVLKGAPLSQAFAKYPKIFPHIYSSMVKVGEKTGKLDEVLTILAAQLERNYQLRSKVKGAMLYPVVIITFMVLIGIVMLVKVVPQLSETFRQLDLQLPPMTKFVIALGDFFIYQWYIVVLILLGIPFLIVTIARTKQGKKQIDAFLLKFPFFSKLIKKINCAYSALTLSALIKGGVPIVTALDISSESVSNTQFKEALKASALDVQKGEKLSSAMSNFPGLFPELFLQMLQIGEETGETSNMLEKLADFFEGQVINTTQNLSSIIEPLLLIIVGGVVGFFAVSMIQPIYSIMQGM